MLIFISHWFTKGERSRANTFLILGNPVTVLWMSVVSGYLVHAFGWRGMFIVEGVPAILWASSGGCWCRTSPRRPAGSIRKSATSATALAAEQARSSRCATTARRSARRR